MNYPRLARHLLVPVSLLLGAFALSACGGARSRPNCDTDERGNLTIVATDRMNPDTDGRPLPTIVRIYQLSSLNSIETASFRDIHTNAEETLGDSLLATDEVTVYPDTRVNRQFERNGDANHIVAVGIFRRPAGVSWRTILDLPPPVAEAQCAALQENPDEPPPEDPQIALTFELEDYRIEGRISVTYPPPPCADDDVLCQQARAAEETANSNAPEQPEAPSTPEAPSAPSAPSAPTP